MGEKRGHTGSNRVGKNSKKYFGGKQTRELPKKRVKPTKPPKPQKG